MARAFFGFSVAALMLAGCGEAGEDPGGEALEGLADGRADSFLDGGAGWEWRERRLGPGEAIDFGARGYWPGPELSFALSEPGASALRLHFSRLDTRYGDQVRLRGADGRVAETLEGPRQGARWSSALVGDEALVTFWPTARASTYNSGFAVDRVEALVRREAPSAGEGPTRIPGEACLSDADCGGLDGHAGLCHRGLCMLRAADDSCPAGSTAACPGGFRCWSGTGLGICYPDCDTYSCEGRCDGDGSCGG